MKKQILLIFLITVGVVFILKSRLFKKENLDFQNCEIPINRFEQQFFSLSVDSFDSQFLDFKKKFPAFFMDTMIDFKNEVFLDDTLRAVLDSVNLIFKERLPKIDELTEGFCNYQRYFPKQDFSIYTFIDKSFDYRTPVVFADKKLFISLHLFLGTNHSFYNFLPTYISYSHDTTFLPASCFLTLAGRHIPYPELDNFLELILHYSKAYFFTQKMLPSISDYELFKCPADKIEWCYRNESTIWRYMIENDYLFSSSTDLIEKFISLAPFSQFGLAGDRESPGSVGVWLGLQIWKSYVENNNVSLIDVLNETDYMKILNNAGYKP